MAPDPLEKAEENIKELYSKTEENLGKINDMRVQEATCRGEMEKHLANIGAHMARATEAVGTLTDQNNKMMEAQTQLQKMHQDVLTWQQVNGPRMDETIRLAKQTKGDLKDLKNKTAPVIQDFSDRQENKKETKRSLKVLSIEILGSAFILWLAALLYEAVKDYLAK